MTHWTWQTAKASMVVVEIRIKKFLLKQKQILGEFFMTRTLDA